MCVSLCSSYLVYSDLLISTSVVKVQYACIDGLLDAAREFFGAMLEP
jgi:hypothetical protein